MYKGATDN